MLTTNIIEIRLVDLLIFYSRNSLAGLSRSNTPIICSSAEQCRELFLKDYICELIENKSLCKTYPKELILPVRSLLALSKSSSSVGSSLYDMEQLQSTLQQSSSARARKRFPVPFLSLGPLTFTRSATVSIPAETIGRNFFTSNSDLSAEDARIQDAYLLSNIYRVKYVFDLMVEEAKVKYGLTVSSSEKVEQEYHDLDILTCPYPGCETFSKYWESKYDPSSVSFSDAKHPPEVEPKVEHVLPEFGKRLAGFERFDLITLTSIYLEMILDVTATSIIKTFTEPNYSAEGVLVHCISGYDRTPLFSGLVRMLLYADGLVHQSLTVSEMVYLVSAYDFFLFGHLLFERFSKGEDIMRFTFDLLAFFCNSQKKYRLSSIVMQKMDDQGLTLEELTNTIDDRDPLVNDLLLLLLHSTKEVKHEDFASKLFGIRQLFLEVWDSEVIRLRPR
ncbi:hypothetical protein GEMRC1_004120 [Eukaryota sp. GEM-RC1]